MPGLLAGCSDWTFTLRGTVPDSDDDDDSISGDNGSDTRLLTDFDLSSREDTAQYKPNPWSIARLNAACRPASTPSREMAPPSNSKKAKKFKQTSLIHAFTKQAGAREKPLISPKTAEKKERLQKITTLSANHHRAENAKVQHLANNEHSEPRVLADMPSSTSKESFAPRKKFPASLNHSKPFHDLKTVSLSDPRLSHDHHRAIDHAQARHNAFSPQSHDVLEGANHSFQPLEGQLVPNSTSHSTYLTPPTHIVDNCNSQPTHLSPFRTAVWSSQHKCIPPDNETHTATQLPLLDAEFDDVSSKIVAEPQTTKPAGFFTSQRQLTPLRPGQRMKIIGNASSGIPHPAFRTLPSPFHAPKAFPTPIHPVQKNRPPVAPSIRSSQYLPQSQSLLPSQLHRPLHAAQPLITETIQLSTSALPTLYSPPLNSALDSQCGSAFAYTPPFTPNARRPSFYHPEVVDPPRDVSAAYIDPDPTIQFPTARHPSIDSSPSPSPPPTKRPRQASRRSVTAYAKLTDPNADGQVWSTLPVRKKHKSSGSAVKKTGKFTIPGLIPTTKAGGGRGKGMAGTERKVTLYRPPPLAETNLHHDTSTGAVILKLRKVGKEEIEELEEKTDLVRRIEQEQEGNWTYQASGSQHDLEQQPGAPDSDRTMVESSSPTPPLSSPSSTVVFSLSTLCNTYPATRKAISERKRSSYEAFEMLTLESCGVVKKDKRRCENIKGEIEIMRWGKMDSI